MGSETKPSCQFAVVSSSTDHGGDFPKGKNPSVDFTEGYGDYRKSGQPGS
jgi:hypothetical protein